MFCMSRVQSIEVERIEEKYLFLNLKTNSTTNVMYAYVFVEALTPKDVAPQLMIGGLFSTPP